MPDYVTAMNHSKNLSGLEAPEIYFVLSCTSIEVHPFLCLPKNFHLHASMTGQEGRIGNCGKSQAGFWSFFLMDNGQISLWTNKLYVHA